MPANDPVYSEDGADGRPDASAVTDAKLNSASIIERHTISVASSRASPCPTVRPRDFAVPPPTRIKESSIPSNSLFSSTAGQAMPVKTPNVLPDWWSFSFIALQVVALGPMIYENLSDPITAFKKAIPPGYDPATDSITSSLRLRMVGGNNAQSYFMIAGLFIGCTLFARNSLRGQPKLQQSLVKLPIFAGLFSDLWLYATMAIMLPPDMRSNPAKWTPAIKGLAFGLPGATTLKMLYLLGIGRDVV